jgi:hypothetical protein
LLFIKFALLDGILYCKWVYFSQKVFLNQNFNIFSPHAVVGVLNDSSVGDKIRKVDLEFATRTCWNAPVNFKAAERMLSDQLWFS